MRTGLHKRGYPNGDMLNGEARAVIDAEFEEITAGRQTQPPMQFMKDVLQWIKKPLHRAK